MNEFVYGVRKRKEGRRNELRSVCWRQIKLMKSLCLFVCLFVCFQSDSMSHSPSLFSLMNHPLSTLYTFAILNPYTKSILIPFLRSFHKQSFLSIPQTLAEPAQSHASFEYPVLFVQTSNTKQLTNSIWTIFPQYRLLFLFSNKVVIDT